MNHQKHIFPAAPEDGCVGLEEGIWASHTTPGYLILVKMIATFRMHCNKIAFEYFYFSSGEKNGYIKDNWCKEPMGHRKIF